MFFKQCAGIAIKGAAFYLKSSAYGAAIGAGVGTVYTVGTSPFAFLHGMGESEVNTIPGAIASGLRCVGKVGGVLVGTGMLIGGAPVTYPMIKAYQRVTERNQPVECEEPSHYQIV